MYLNSYKHLSTMLWHKSNGFLWCGTNIALPNCNKDIFVDSPIIENNILHANNTPEQKRKEKIISLETSTLSWLIAYLFTFRNTLIYYSYFNMHLNASKESLYFSVGVLLYDTWISKLFFSTEISAFYVLEI